MRVLHVGKFYPPVRGGMETVLQLLCEGERKVIDTRVLVANTRPSTVHEVVNDVPVIRVACFGAIRSVAVCPMFPLWLGRQCPDVTVIHEPNPLGVASYLLARPSGRLLVWFHSEVIRQRWLYSLYRPFLRRILKLADRVIVSSPKLAEHAEELQDFRSKCTVVPFGIELERLACTPMIVRRVEALRSQYRAPVILFVGRMVGYKGVEVLLRALCGLDATAILIGEGPLLSRLKNLAGTLGIQNQAVFAGEKADDELVALYHACDVFVLPAVSRNEAFGMVQLEAMACGKPVVSTDLPSGVPWVNRHGETGLIVPPGSVTALRDALSLLLKDEPLRRDMGERGRKRVVAEFTRERMVSRTVELYRQIVS